MKSGQLKVALFIPTFNSEDTVIDVLKRIPAELKSTFGAIYVFDNVSSDQTVSRVTDFAKQNAAIPLRIFRNSENYFLGGSTVLAIRQALRDQFDYLICMHSDGQADPRDLPEFVSRCLENKYDFILGSRLLSKSKTEEYSRIRLLANQIFAKLQQPILGAKVFDLGAFVGFNLGTLKDLPFDRVPTDMAYHPNLILTLAKVSKAPLRFSEFPIRWGAVHSSSINVYSYALKHLSRILRLYFAHPDLSKDFGSSLRTEKVWPN